MSFAPSSGRAPRSSAPAHRVRRCIIASVLVAGTLTITAASARAQAFDSMQVQAPGVGSAAPAVDVEGAPSRSEDALGPVRLGAVGGVGFPRPLSVEGLVDIDRRVSLGLEYGVLPQVTVSGVDVTMNALDVDLRVFPLRTPFFIGAAVGRQQTDLSASATIPTVGAFSEQVSAETWFVTPRIGVLWTASWGLTLGADVGVQIPVSATLTESEPGVLALSPSATDAARWLAKGVLPSVDLLRLGLVL
jgi:hypothetical protein